MQPDVVEATVVLDMALANGVVTLNRFNDYVATQAGTRGVELARASAEHADEHSGSPQETRLRLAWRALGFPRPLVNVAVYSVSGRLLGYPDLLDEEAGLVVEYDGADHRSATRHSDDVDREARFRATGLEVTRVTGADLMSPGRLAQRLHSARSRARFEPVTQRRWTLEPGR